MRRMALLLIGSLLTFSLACLNSNTPSPAPAATVTSGPTDAQPAEPETIAVTAESSELPEIDSGAIASLDSFRSRLSLHRELGEEISDATFQMEEVRNPNRKSMIIVSSEGGEELSKSFELVIIDDERWVNMFNIWTRADPQGTADTEEFFGADFIELSNSDLEGFKLADEETINDMRTLHYYSEDPDAWINFASVENMGIISVTKTRADVWLSIEEDFPTFPVKINIFIAGQGKVDDKEVDGSISIVQEVYDINTEIVIERPPDDMALELPEDIPAYENTTNGIHSLGSTMFSFYTTDDLDVISAFYKEEMPALGWTLVKEETSSIPRIQDWTQDNRTVSILMMINPDKEANQVMITIKDKE